MKEIDVPGGVKVALRGPEVSVSGPAGEVERRLSYPGVRISDGDGYLRVEAESEDKELLTVEGTFAAHLENMVEGVSRGFEYRLKVLYSHFPIQVNVRGDRVFIENFMGENEARTAQIVGGSEVEVSGDEVVVKGADKEALGQTAANIEQATRIKGKDPRVFQDGIYIIDKP